MISGEKMKNIKRWMSILVGIGLCCVLGYHIVFAENLPTYYLSEKINHDKTLIATVSFTENVAAAGTITLSYHTDKLKLLSAEKGTSKAQIITLNEHEFGTVSINFLNVEDVIKDDTTIAILKFRINADHISEHDIQVDRFKLYNLDSQLISDHTTAVPVYKLENENDPAEIPITSRTEEDSKERSETSAEKTDQETSAENPDRDTSEAEKSDRDNSTMESRNIDDDSDPNSSRSQEKTDGSVLTEEVSAVQENTSGQDSSEAEVISDDSGSSVLSDQGRERETFSEHPQSESVVSKERVSQDTGTDTTSGHTVRYVMIMAIVILTAVCSVLIIIVYKNAKKESRRH